MKELIDPLSYSTNKTIYIFKFEQVLNILEDAAERKHFINKLKNIGKNSEAFIHLQHSMEKLGLNQTSRGIHQKHILQHSFQFLSPAKCFTRLRLVCKS